MILKPEDLFIEHWSSRPRAVWNISCPRGVRIKHLPSGVTIQYDGHPTLHGNKMIAMAYLEREVKRYYEEHAVSARIISGSTIKALQDRQAKWLKSRGWWRNKTPLEALMLVVSEVGEAANEVRGEVPTDKFQTELADIVLRVLGIAAEHCIDLENALLDKMSRNEKLPLNPDRLK